MVVVSDFAWSCPRTTPPPPLKLPRSLLQAKGTVSLICVPLLGISYFSYIWYLAHRLRLDQCLTHPANGHPQTTTGEISSVILGASPGLPGGPAVTLRSQSGAGAEPRFSPRSGNWIPHAATEMGCRQKSKCVFFFFLKRERFPINLLDGTE